MIEYQWNPPPGWPPPPENWRPPLGWIPDPEWPPAPPGWNFWRRKRLPELLAFLGILGFAAGLPLFLFGSSIQVVHVTAQPFRAVAKQSLPQDQCHDLQTLKLSYTVGDKEVDAIDYAPDCNRSYSSGDTFRIWVSSYDQSIGPDRDWILSPDQHDPMDLGPNAQRGTLQTGGVALMIAGFGMIVTAGFSHIRRRREDGPRVRARV